jgi:glc operon protein GlcG
MTKLGMSVGILATVSCQSVGAQTISVLVLDQAGAQTVLDGCRASGCHNLPASVTMVDGLPENLRNNQGRNADFAVE